MPEKRSRYAFGPFVLVPRERQLFVDGRPLPMGQRPFDVLARLVEQPGQLVVKEDLLDAAWPGVVVEENTLSVTISRLRTELGERGRGLIETVPGHGYRLVTPVIELADDDASGPTLTPGMEDVTASIVYGGDGVAPAVPRPADPGRPAWGVAALVCLGAVVLIGALATWGTRTKHAPPAHEPALQALRAYNRGRELWEARTYNSNVVLWEYKRAAQIDPAFARAHLGQAQVYAFMYGSGEEAEAAIARALERDPTLGEAWATRAFVRALQHWDWAGAETAFVRARELDPENVTALQWMATVRMIQRRFPEAQTLLTRAIARAPEYAVLHADLCELHYYQRDLEAARAACDRARLLSPHMPTVARNTELIESLEPGGRTIAERRLESEGRHIFDTTLRARLFARLGARDSTLALVEQAVADRDYVAPFFNADPHYDFLRADPRWKAAMRAMGL